MQQARSWAMVIGLGVGSLWSSAQAAEMVSLQYQALATSTPGVWKVYLAETSATTLLGSELGLSDAGVKITRTSGNAVISAVSANAVAGVGFDDSSTSASSSSSSASLSLHTQLTRSVGVLPEGSAGVLLGTLTIAAGTSDSTFSISSWGSPNYSITYLNIKNVDAAGSVGGSYQWSAAQGSTLAVAAVPEPASLGLLTLLVGGLLTRQRRQ